MSSRLMRCLLSPLNFIRGVKTQVFRQNERTDFPNSKGLNFLTFCWLTDWVFLNFHNELTDSELPSLDPVDSDLSKVELLESLLNKKINWFFKFFDRLYLAIYLTFWKSFLALIILGLLRDIMDFLNVLLLKTILKNMQTEAQIDNKLLSGLVTALLCVLQTFDIFFDTHFFYYYYRLEIRIESTLGALISKRAIYNPANENEKSNLSKFDDGANLLNLQLFDIENTSWGTLAITDLLLTPFRVVIIAIWLYNQVGSAFTSTIIVGVITILMCFLQIKSSSFVKLYLKKLDSRVIATKNILDNIRTFRLIRWIDYSKEAIFTSRIQELQICNKRAYLYSVSHWLGSVLPHVVSLITFLIYLMNKAPDLSLDASVSIPLMHTITYLIRPLKHLSSHLAYHLSGMASSRRIYKYLTLHSPNSDNISYNDEKFEENLIKILKNNRPKVIISQSTGKHTFLSQLQYYSLKLNYEYIHTTPTTWLPSGTVRSIITFIHPYNELLYNKIVSCCGLIEDFDSWEDGDFRTIDEKGGSLSTGQRTRIAMARSIYHQEIKQMQNSSVIHLLDNAFSVLDPGLANEIFFSLFSNLNSKNLNLNSKTFILMDEKQIKNIDMKSMFLSFYDYNLNPISILSFTDIKSTNLNPKNMLESDSDSARKKLKITTAPESDTSTPQLPLLRRYVWYLRHVGYFPLSILIFFTITSAVTHIITDFIIGRWSSESKNGRTFLFLFTLFTSFTIVSDLLKSLYQAIGTISGAKNTYESSVSGVLQSPMDFYDNMPVGRILNRLSTDQNYVDQSLFHRFCEVISSLSSIVLVLLSLCYLNPICILIFPFFSILVYFWVFKHYLRVNKDVMKRILRKRSPLCTVCNQCIDGESIIRSFKAEDYMYKRYLNSLLEYQRMKFIKISSVAWALLRLRALSLPLGFASAIFTPHKSAINLDPTPRLGLALSYSFAFAKLTRHLINTIVQLETEMCCASRLQELSTSTYGNYKSNSYHHLYNSIHDSVAIQFPPPCLDYTDVNILKLCNSFHFTKGHYGIVGRTGAGKTTLLNYISGIIPFDGTIEIDGININLLTDNIMSEVVGVIPHHIPLLTGWTIRNYVNPMGIHPDLLIYDALRKAGLANFIKTLKSDDPLSVVIMDRDNNVKSTFTPLIIQHISLARLILHAKSLRVILVDEPRHSDKYNIPQVGIIIKEFLNHCTAFIIAHNISSLDTCNLICLVEDGRIVKSLPRQQFQTQYDLVKFIN